MPGHDRVNETANMRDVKRTPFARQVREARLVAGYGSLDAASEKAGMDVCNLSRLETRVGDPRWSTVHRLITRLGLPLERFFPAELILEAAGRLGTKKARREV